MLSREAIVALDKTHVWHPYTPMARYIAETDPLVVVRAEGSRLFDADGRSYLDATSSWWLASLGHNHPRLVGALADQAAKLCHASLAGATNEPAAALAEEISKRAPAGMKHVFYSDDGSTAIEAAIKMALKLFVNEGRPEKRRFVALDGAFHGETLGVTSLLGIDVFRRPYASALMECVHVPTPAGAGPDHARAFEAIETLLRKEHESIAAVVLEPIVQGVAGMWIYDPSYLRRVRELTRELDVLLVVDEVFTGYGRTGTFWASEQAGIVPDLLCTAKGFSGGILPMAATLATSRVFDAFLGAPERAFFYGHSYCGHPLGAAVAREVLRVYDEERVVEGVAERSRRIRETFEAIAAAHPEALRPRAIGMIGAIDLASDASYLGGLGWRASAKARELGAYLRPLGDVVYLAPPLNIPLADLDELCDIVKRSVAHALSSAG